MLGRSSREHKDIRAAQRFGPRVSLKQSSPGEGAAWAEGGVTVSVPRGEVCAAGAQDPRPGRLSDHQEDVQEAACRASVTYYNTRM